MQIKIEDDFWQGDDEAVITAWLVDDGAEVAEGDVVAEMMLAKVQMEIEAPCSGVIHIEMEAEVPLKKGMVIATIDQ
ncbi:lipoyl domain-containing protein [Kordiimonas gwangyangensis]|uniref:lipoyl domain-containing protein n=1 Tax=Kordiimonas gwangyangensis TaxID=288022 RepID=UPI000367BCF5|nr:lipoyl domain-containing protein [Kordiimonas gwangyangensis]